MTDDTTVKPMKAPEPEDASSKSDTTLSEGIKTMAACWRSSPE
jgi:hypothetical protein